MCGAQVGGPPRVVEIAPQKKSLYCTPLIGTMYYWLTDCSLTQVRRRQLAINRKNKNLRNRAGPNNRNATSRATNKVAMVPGT